MYMYDIRGMRKEHTHHIYMYTRMRTTYICIHAYAPHSYVYTHTHHIYMYTCIRTTYICLHVYAPHIYVYTYTSIHIGIRICLASLHIYKHSYMYVNCMCIRTYTFSHTCLLPAKLERLFFGRRPLYICISTPPSLSLYIYIYIQVRYVRTHTHTYLLPTNPERLSFSSHPLNSVGSWNRSIFSNTFSAMFLTLYFHDTIWYNSIYVSMSYIYQYLHILVHTCIMQTFEYLHILYMHMI